MHFIKLTACTFALSTFAFADHGNLYELGASPDGSSALREDTMSVQPNTPQRPPVNPNAQETPDLQLLNLIDINRDIVLQSPESDGTSTPMNEMGDLEESAGPSVNRNLFGVFDDVADGMTDEETPTGPTTDRSLFDGAIPEFPSLTNAGNNRAFRDFCNRLAGISAFPSM
jgi:hypothetical protein